MIRILKNKESKIHPFWWLLKAHKHFVDLYGCFIDIALHLIYFFFLQCGKGPEGDTLCIFYARHHYPKLVDHVTVLQSIVFQLDSIMKKWIYCLMFLHIFNLNHWIYIHIYLYKQLIACQSFWLNIKSYFHNKLKLEITFFLNF